MTKPARLKTGAIPLVSIVMPVYNAAPYLAEAIRSILAQTWADFELIVVDDASTDRSPDLIQSFPDPRIRCVRNDQNLGVAATRNRGVLLARGEFVAQMDPDDVAHPRRIAEQVAFLRAHPDVGLCGAKDGTRRVMKMPLDHEEIRVTLLFHSSFAQPTVMARRRLLVEDGLLYNETYRNMEDYDLWCRLVDKTRTANLNQVLLDYRCHNHQLSREYSQSQSELLGKLHRQTLAKLVPDLSEADLALHHHIFLYGDAADVAALGRASAWLHRLSEANRCFRIYDDRAMQRVLGLKWAWLCGQATAKGCSVLWLYLHDPLSGPVRYSVETLKLAIKCFLKR
jgi:glycosyltransferase involved in cell wall biosynthesis